jgi:hypothetical protein
MKRSQVVRKDTYRFTARMFSTLKTVKAEQPRTTVNGGKIYTVGNLLFQVEQDSGIHIINYANPSSPQKLGFIKSFFMQGDHS